MSFPFITVPASRSMMSFILSNKLVLLDIFKTGDIGLPVGVPRPVVKIIILQPDPARPVVLSTSFPGVQTKFKPVLLIFSA